MKVIKLSDRALDDLDEIEQYSITQFGNQVANKYIDDIEQGLNLLQENKQLLQALEGFTNSLKYYRVRNHFLICIEVKNSIFVLTIKHVQMDVMTRLAELEPSLLIEVELLLEKIAKDF